MEVIPKEISIWRQDQLEGLVNVYNDIEEYNRLVTLLRKQKSGLRFFGSGLSWGSILGFFFKSENLGRNTIQGYVKDACNKINITGTGLR